MYLSTVLLDAIHRLHQQRTYTLSAEAWGCGLNPRLVFSRATSSGTLNSANGFVVWSLWIIASTKSPSSAFADTG
jgi:hypothetical protein